MAPTMMIKNTFISFVDDCSMVKTDSARRRAVTDWEALSSSSRSTDAFSDDDCSDSGDSFDFPDTPCPLNTFELPTFFPHPVADLTANSWEFLGQSSSAQVFDCTQAASFLEALRQAGSADALSLMNLIRGRVPDAARSAVGSDILTEGITKLGTEDMAFIAEELLQVAQCIALNIHGHSVLCRLLNYSSEHPSTRALMDEVLCGDVTALCLHKFGHIVAMSVLSSGLDHQRQIILASLRQDLPRYARHRFATLVLVEAFEFGQVQECGILAVELMQKPGTVLALACHAFGVNVVRAMLNLAPLREQVLYFLTKSAKRVIKDRYGSELMRELGFDVPCASPPSDACSV